jgi:hypothetical protein
METKVSLAIQSHLSDAIIKSNHLTLTEEAQEHLHFVKYLVANFPNTNEKIDVDVLYDQWRTCYLSIPIKTNI